MTYTVPPLPYPYDALEPFISARTLDIHYSKHHQAYTDAFNKALDQTPAPYCDMPPEILLKNLDRIEEPTRTALRNFGGGYVNHTFFWSCMRKKTEGQPKGQLADAMQRSFRGFQFFKKEFSIAAQHLFGSGWTWLVCDQSGNLRIVCTPNQDSPLSQGLTPLLTLDVWEHAYYLDYQNRRTEFIDKWWHIVNWEFVEQNYAAVPR